MHFSLLPSTVELYLLYQSLQSDLYLYWTCRGLSNRERLYVVQELRIFYPTSSELLIGTDFAASGRGTVL